MKRKNKNFIQYEQRIIDAFVKLSKKRNNKSVSITDIVKEAKMTRPTFYLHFKSVNDIYKKLEDQLTEKYLSYFTKDVKERSADILQSNFELSKIAQENEDLFRCFVYSDRYNQFIVELNNKLCDSLKLKEHKEYLNKYNNDIGWWDWLCSYTVIETHFNTVAQMIKGAFEVDYDFLTYWCANLTYNLIHDTWSRLGIKVEKHDYLKEYLEYKKNK